VDEDDSPAWRRPVFTIGPTTVTVADVIDAAHFRGEIAPFVRENAALSGTETGDVDEAALQSMSEQFRVDRDLITAEETERWLDERGLTLDDFSGYFSRHCAADSLDEGNTTGAINCAALSEEQRNLLRVELLFSGEFDRMAVRLAWRLAVRDAAGGECPPETGGRDRAWREELAKIEAMYQQRCAALHTPDVCERMLNALRLPLTRLEVETIDLESRDAAREAFLCVSEDGMTMAEVAKAGRYPYRRAEFLCEDIPADLQQIVLSAAPGDVLDPIERGDAFQLCRLVQKIEPDLADARIRGRVEQRILDSHFSELATERIVWIIPPSSIHDRRS
jgi:hypothetical protein